MYTDLILTLASFLMKMKVGIALMLYSWAASSFSSTSTFKNTTSDISVSICSIWGAITLHGPHLKKKWLLIYYNLIVNIIEMWQKKKYVWKLIQTYHVAKKSTTTNLSPAALSCSFSSARVAHCLTILIVLGCRRFWK